jgi:hypothetical protein
MEVKRIKEVIFPLGVEVGNEGGKEDPKFGSISSQGEVRSCYA